MDCYPLPLDIERLDLDLIKDMSAIDTVERAFVDDGDWGSEAVLSMGIDETREVTL